MPDEVFYGAKQNFPPEETPADAGTKPAPEEEQDLEEYWAAINERRHLTRFWGGSDVDVGAEEGDALE